MLKAPFNTVADLDKRNLYKSLNESKYYKTELYKYISSSHVSICVLTLLSL